MPRKIGIEYNDAIYHVMSRGDRRKDIFCDDVDRQDFIKTLAEACQKTGWQVHAYCLMANHFHRVVETPLANLVAGMRWLNREHGRDPSKLELAWQIRRETTLTMKWIATRLHLGKLPTAYASVRALDKTVLKQYDNKDSAEKLIIAF